MTDFYQQMAGVVTDLTKPTAQGGLGQGSITLTHITPGVPDPAKPWEQVAPTTTTEPLQGAARGVSSRLIGAEVGGTVIVATDRQVITTVPKIAYKSGDTMTIDGKPVRIIDVQNIPAAGIARAVKWVVR